MVKSDSALWSPGGTRSVPWPTVTCICGNHSCNIGVYWSPDWANEESWGRGWLLPPPHHLLPRVVVIMMNDIGLNLMSKRLTVYKIEEGCFLHLPDVRFNFLSLSDPKFHENEHECGRDTFFNRILDCSDNELQYPDIGMDLNIETAYVSDMRIRNL